MSNLLITASLLSSLSWYTSAPTPDKKADALGDLMRMLTRAPFKPTPEISRGIDFESAVYLAARTGKMPEGASPAFVEFVDLAKHGAIQRVAKRFLTLDDMPLCLYAKADVVYPDTIFDIKTAKRFSEIKYTSSAQAWLYMFAFGIPRFEYRVAVMGECPSVKILSTHSVKVEAAGANEIEWKAVEKVSEALDVLKGNAVLFDAWSTKFSRPY